MGTATGIIKALNSGIKHIALKRFTLRYPEEKLKFVGDGYQFDPTTGVGIAGLKGRHMLFHDHCTVLKDDICYFMITVLVANFAQLHVRVLLRQLEW
jgi:hypothetical protein